MLKTCLKCGHVNPSATNQETAACPQCGAIYSRVEAAVAAGKFRPINQAKPAPEIAVSQQAAPDVDLELSPEKKALPVIATVKKPAEKPFIEVLRHGTNYPTPREVVTIIYITSCALFVIVGSIASFTLFSQQKVGTAFGFIFGAIFLIVISKVFKESVLMMVDLSDAAVLTAENISRINKL